MSGLRSGAHECQIRSAPVLVLPRLQRFSITLKRRQRAKINIILALCQQFERGTLMVPLFSVFILLKCFLPE
ncbi:hypothetical protein FZC68_14720 [Bacillus pumilus]|uniref:Uncharacterized protein n=1 Tax=Bacillus pumilus TaxID=1408 RepID=A0AAD0HRV6_BACPU|nr:hypothetical protein C5695_19460 [Bacillus pumilus]TYS41166.1 hypothetical protein FZC68_14720 [Bacillus pumilus]